MVRPAYEFMSSEAAPLHGIRYIQHGYGVPESPPQSPPEFTTRLRARPYSPFHRILVDAAVDDVLDAHRGVMRTQSSDQLSRIGRVIRTMNHVQRTLKSDGAINVGAIKGIFPLILGLIIDITLTTIFSVESLICWKIKLSSGQKNFGSPNLRFGYKIWMFHICMEQGRRIQR